jgi:type II secretory pathway component GspD/PulD (secretin)
MKFTEHIEISEWKGQYLITVRDVELHDFLDDLFVQAGLEPLVVLPPDNPGALQLLFQTGTTSATILRILNQVGLREIERIFHINSGAIGQHDGA